MRFLESVIDDMVARIRSSFSGLTGIVYCLSRKDAEQVAHELGQPSLLNLNQTL